MMIETITWRQLRYKSVQQVLGSHGGMCNGLEMVLSAGPHQLDSEDKGVHMLDVWWCDGCALLLATGYHSSFVKFTARLRKHGLMFLDMSQTMASSCLSSLDKSEHKACSDQSFWSDAEERSLQAKWGTIEYIFRSCEGRPSTNSPFMGWSSSNNMQQSFRLISSDLPTLLR